MIQHCLLPQKRSIENEAGKVIASFQQIPLRLAWAITIHKSQGMTLEAAEINLSHTFEKGQGYVALSRLKSLVGLKLVGFNDRALELDSLAIKADRRFQELSQEAETHFADTDLTAQHKAFIRHCGGTLNETEIQRNEKKLPKQEISRIMVLLRLMKPRLYLKMVMIFRILHRNAV